MTYIQTIKKETRFYLKTLKDDIQQRKDKDFFRYSGTQIYCGKQGQGKTASAVHHVTKLKLRYPRSIVVTNLLLSRLKPVNFKTQEDLAISLNSIDFETHYIHFQDMDQLAIALVAINNGKYGVIYLIDEIHTYFNALDSKNIPMYVFTEISQQRKQRKLIIGTSQLFMRAAKPLREQCDTVIMCRTYFGVLTTQKAYIGDELEQDYSGKLVGQMKKHGWFIQTRELRESFDTYQKVVSGLEQYETQRPLEITINKKSKFSMKK